MNLATLLDPHPDDRPALRHHGRTVTYGELRQRVGSWAGALVEGGLEPGDRVGIVAANTPVFVTAWFAALRAGLVSVPLNPHSPAPELTRQLATVGARAVVIGPTGAAVCRAIAADDLPDLELRFAPAGTDMASAAVLPDDGPDPGVADRDPSDLAALLFTSGTAGTPRAAMLGHGNIAANLEQILAGPERRLDADDIVLGVLPFSHVFGLTTVIALSACVGASIVLMEAFDPSVALDEIRDEGVTVVAGPPTMWSALAATPGCSSADVSTVRLALSGAAKLAPEVADAVGEKLGLRLVEGYGLTETAPVVASGFGVEAPVGSVGRPLPGVEVRLVDDDGDDVLVGDAGEVWVRGPNVFQGYWNDPEATEAVLDADGWLHTGDLAVVDDHGCLHLVDRVKDLIIVSGFNVYPAEVEEVLDAHPAVAESAVVGVPHPHTGEAVRALVVSAPGTQTDADELIAHCAAQLARYKCPSSVSFVDELPRGATGKVVRRQLER